MINPVTRAPILNPAAGNEQLNRVIWRDRLQAEILEKVRSASSEIEKTWVSMPASFQKGEHLDFYV
jgi:hypothetical protein